MKTSELEGAPLDWAVHQCERPGDKLTFFINVRKVHSAFHYSINWSLGGPIIEEHQLDIAYSARHAWMASYAHADPVSGSHFDRYGPTPLIAAMRCYVASKLGEEVEIPKEFL